MEAEDILAVAATGWGVLMAVAPVLQIRRMFHTRSSRDVSLTYLFVLLPGFVLWLAYGLSIANLALIISNVAALSVMVVTLAVALAFRRGKGRDAVEVRPPSTTPAVEADTAAPRR